MEISFTTTKHKIKELFENVKLIFLILSLAILIIFVIFLLLTMLLKIIISSEIIPHTVNVDDL